MEIYFPLDPFVCLFNLVVLMMTKHTTSTQNVRRTRTIKLRVTDQELASLREQSADTALAVYIRQQLFHGNVVTTKRQQRKTPARDQRNTGCAVLAREVAKIGSNLNQIARAANISIKANKPVDLVIVAIRLNAVWEKLNVLQNIQTWSRQGCGD